MRTTIITLIVIAMAASAFVALLGIGAVCAGKPESRPAQDADAARAAELTEMIPKLTPLCRKLGEPKPGDWLAYHAERGQSFAEYLHCGPVLPVGKRSILYIQPLGEFTKSQRRIVELTAGFMADYFNLTVRTKPDLPLSLVPASARRTGPGGAEQILTTYVLQDVLPPRLPDDAAAYLAFTASDLWPGPGWNFVFGQASLRDRVGVWSIHRNGDPDGGEDAFRLCLLRTLKTATHETGHMFSMQHCIAWECNMCGSNSRRESDARTILLCPQCLAKVCWATKADPVDRYRKLLAFCREQGLDAEATEYEQHLRALGAEVAPPSRPAAGQPAAAP